MVRSSLIVRSRPFDASADFGGWPTFTTSRRTRKRRRRSAAWSHRRLRFVRSRALVLAAGTFGTNFLLLRNRASSLPAISDRLGHGFSGNGDFLGFMTNVGHVVAASDGQVITSTIRRPDWSDDPPHGEPPLDAALGHYVQDGGYPGLVDWLTELTPPTGLIHREPALAVSRIRQLLIGDSPANVSRKLAILLDGGRQSSSILPMLVMGRDAPDSLLSLRKGFLELEQGRGSKEYVRQVRATLEEIARQLRARYRDYMSKALSRWITVHPLGGAAMSKDSRSGVVDSYGRVFGYQKDHLYVMDGSVMPEPIGPNPAMTIAALAHRFSKQLVDDLPQSMTSHPRREVHPMVTPQPQRTLSGFRRRLPGRSNSSGRPPARTVQITNSRCPYAGTSPTWTPSSTIPAIR